MKEKLLKFILKCKASEKPDLHSFVIVLNDGKAFVECGDYGDIWLERIIYRHVGEEESRVNFRGTPDEVAEYLVGNGAIFETIVQ